MRHLFNRYAVLVLSVLAILVWFFGPEAASLLGDRAMRAMNASAPSLPPAASTEAAARLRRVELALANVGPLQLVGRVGDDVEVAFTLEGAGGNGLYPGLIVTYQAAGAPDRLIRLAPTDYPHGEQLVTERIILRLAIRGGERRIAVDVDLGDEL